MKNLLRILLLPALLVTVPAFADDEKPLTDKGWYIGAGMSLGWGQEKLEYGQETYKEEASSIASDFTLGYITRLDHRFEVTYHLDSIETDASNKNGKLTSLDFEWQFTFSDNLLEPYFRSGLGFASSAYLEEGVDLHGVSIQLGTGLIYRLTYNIEVDLGIKARAIGWRATQHNGEDLVVSTVLTQTTGSIRYIF